MTTLIKVTTECVAFQAVAYITYAIFANEVANAAPAPTLETACAITNVSTFISVAALL